MADAWFRYAERFMLWFGRFATNAGLVVAATLSVKVWLGDTGAESALNAAMRIMVFGLACWVTGLERTIRKP